MTTGQLSRVIGGEKEHQMYRKEDLVITFYLEKQPVNLSSFTNTNYILQMCLQNISSKLRYMYKLIYSYIYNTAPLYL